MDLLVAVDALQSLNGLAKPFASWADWRDIHQRGVRYDIPDVPQIAQTAVPPARFRHVGSEWDDTAEPAEWTGLRDPYLESLTADSASGPSLQVTADGREVWALPTAQQFSVDAESAFLISEFEVDRLLEVHDAGVAPGQVTAGYRWYAQYGCLTLSHSQRAEHDEIARRTAYKDRLGLTLEYDVDRGRFPSRTCRRQGSWHGGKNKAPRSLDFGAFPLARGNRDGVTSRRPSASSSREPSLSRWPVWRQTIGPGP